MLFRSIRNKDPKNRTRKLLSLTDRGFEISKRMFDINDEWEKAMLKDKTSKDYKSWGKEDYVKLAHKNPIKFLNKTHGEFFIKRDDCALALSDDLREFIKSESFIEHFRDIIEYRTVTYYKYRFEAKK